MKKVFAIIAILVVLVGAVFANDTNAVDGRATITVQSLVSRLIPIFELRAKLGDTTFTSSTSADVTDATGTETISNDGIQTYVDNTTNAFDGELLATGIDISVDDITVNFGIFQVNKANVDATYTITYSAGKLTRVATDNGDYVAAGSPDAYVINNAGNIGTANTDVVQITAITKVDPTGNDAKYAISSLTEGANAGGISINYDGTVDASTSNILLGTFQVKWLHDVNAKDGEYRADVVLTVTGA